MFTCTVLWANGNMCWRHKMFCKYCTKIVFTGRGRNQANTEPLSVFRVLILAERHVRFCFVSDIWRYREWFWLTWSNVLNVSAWRCAIFKTKTSGIMQQIRGPKCIKWDFFTIASTVSGELRCPEYDLMTILQKELQRTEHQETLCSQTKKSNTEQLIHSSLVFFSSSPRVLDWFRTFHYYHIFEI